MTLVICATGASYILVAFNTLFLQRLPIDYRCSVLINFPNELLFLAVTFFGSVKMYADDQEIVPLQGVAVKYKSTLDKGPSLVHNTVYTQDTTYTKGELRAPRPETVLQWMNQKAFVVTDPPVDANPTLARSNSLVFWKKAISFFMPNHLFLHGHLVAIKETPPAVLMSITSQSEKKQLCKQGMASQCRRAITEVEFQRMQHILQKNHKFLNLN